MRSCRCFSCGHEYISTCPSISAANTHYDITAFAFRRSTGGDGYVSRRSLACCTRRERQRAAHTGNTRVGRLEQDQSAGRGCSLAGRQGHRTARQRLAVSGHYIEVTARVMLALADGHPDISAFAVRRFAGMEAEVSGGSSACSTRGERQRSAHTACACIDRFHRDSSART